MGASSRRGVGEGEVRPINELRKIELLLREVREMPGDVRIGANKLVDRVAWLVREMRANRDEVKRLRTELARAKAGGMRIIQ